MQSRKLEKTQARDGLAIMPPPPEKQGSKIHLSSIDMIIYTMGVKNNSFSC